MKHISLYFLIRNTNMVTTIIPTCHISGMMLEDPREQIVYILRHFTSIPSGVSNTFSNEEISFHKLNAEHGNDSNSLASAVSRQLTTVYERIFPNNNVIVVCTPIAIDDKNYNLSIDVQVTVNKKLVQIGSVLKISSSGQIDLDLYSGV